MEKLRSARGYLNLTQTQINAGQGPAEECRDCGRSYCGDCYPNDDKSCACGGRKRKLILVQYSWGPRFLRRPHGTSRPEFTASPGPLWATLVRRYLACGVRSDIDDAIMALSQTSHTARAGAARFFGWVRRHEPVDNSLVRLAVAWRDRDIPSVVRLCNLCKRQLLQERREIEALTVALLPKDLLVMQGEAFLGAHPAEQIRILHSALAACAEAAQIANLLHDQICEAGYLTRLGNGLYSARRLEEAEDALRRALARWNAAAQHDPDRYLPKVAQVLRHLADVLDKRHKVTDALSAYREVIELLQSLGAQELELARAYNNCAGLHEFRNERDKARTMYNQACEAYRELLTRTEAPSAPALLEIRFEYSRCLANLARTLISPQDWSAAEDAFGEAIRIQESILSMIPNLVVLQLARSKSGLGEVFFNHWYAEHMAQNAENQHPLLVRSYRELSEAAQIYSRNLPPEDTAFHEPRNANLINLAVVLAWMGKPDQAYAVLRPASGLFEANGSWAHRASAYDALRFIQTRAANDPAAGFEYADAAVECVEEGVTRLGVAERQHRDLFKGSIETCYATCLAEYARRGNHEKVFHLLESMRRIDRLATPGRDAVAHDEVTLALAAQLARQHQVGYLAIHVVPGGLVFFGIWPSGDVRICRLPAGWRAEVDEFFDSINLEMRLAGASPGRDAGFAESCRKLFDMLPEPVKELLTGEARYVFLSPGGYFQNLPFEFLRMPSGSWCGTSTVYPRVHSFEELRTVLSRQPAADPKTALVAGDPENNLSVGREAAADLARKFKSHGFQLAPNGEPLLGTSASHWDILDGLNARISAGVFIGHGAFDEYGGYLKLGASEEPIRPRYLQHLQFEYNPIIHFECCDAGQSVYHEGGYQEGLAVASLAIGASACLVSNRLRFEQTAAQLSRTLYDGLLSSGATVGEALLQARREVAREYPSPLYWALPTLYGNPDARLIFAEAIENAATS